ncbi:MAG: class I tRNA ligase family protein, partial [Patescibacteria group bacterium]
MNKQYDPKNVENNIYDFWMKSGFFNPDNLPGKRTKPYSMVLPPPNVTGQLHMGHALNATMQDIIIRRKRMQGYLTLWIPGTDHAGIATQNVVEKKLKKEGKTRFDVGKKELIKEIWEWKEKYGNIILSQFKKIGSSCDWSRTRFTMDDDYQMAVKEAFLKYKKAGLIYKGERVINWCSRCQSSLSDMELEHKEEKTK